MTDSDSKPKKGPSPMNDRMFFNQIPLTKKEMLDINELAATNDQSMSEYMRGVITNHRKISKAALTMATAIQEWQKARTEREAWIPNPGEIPPAHFAKRARECNELLDQALEQYVNFCKSIEDL